MPELTSPASDTPYIAPSYIFNRPKYTFFLPIKHPDMSDIPLTPLTGAAADTRSSGHTTQHYERPGKILSQKVRSFITHITTRKHQLYLAVRGRRQPNLDVHPHMSSLPPLHMLHAFQPVIVNCMLFSPERQMTYDTCFCEVALRHIQRVFNVNVKTDRPDTKDDLREGLSLVFTPHAIWDMGLEINWMNSRAGARPADVDALVAAET
jgi:hypothetical protein